LGIPTASTLAKDFLAVLPMKNQEDLLQKLKDLSSKYTPAKFVYQKEMAKEESHREQHALTQMQHAIRQGNIEHAINVAKSLQNNP